MQLCQAVCDSVYTVRLYQARFRESLCFPALPEYLSASYFFSLLLLSVVSCIVDSFSDGNCDENCQNCDHNVLWNKCC